MPFRFTALSLALLLPLLAGCGGGGNKGSSGTSPTPTPPTTPVIDTSHELFYDASPGSTLLPAGVTSQSFALSTNQNVSCRYSVGSDKGWAAMTPFDGGQGTRSHTVTFKGLNPDTSVVNEVYVRCDTVSDQVLHLRYRVLPKVNPSYPKKGNLWGWWAVLTNGGIDHCKRVDLWLGAHAATEAQVAQLRALNPNVLFLDSINTVERSDIANVPDSYWLKDVNGKKIEVWNDTYRLNLTKPEVAAFQAQYAYKRFLDRNLCHDGMFFDNFYTSESWYTKDMWGNTVQTDADGDGKADDPAALDKAWKAGVYAELLEWRKYMPYAYASGHLSDSNNEETGTIFNGNSMGYLLPGIKEGITRYSLPNTWEAYHSWWELGQKPTLVMTESGPPFQIAYGYGFQPYKSTLPAATMEFARTFYPYMRWGLGFTLMNDGYFAHELGDTLHGQDWWYDELDQNLGQPTGAAQRINIGTTPTTDSITNGGFESAFSPAWIYGLDTSTGAAATFQRDASVASSGTGSCRVDITNAGEGVDWKIIIAQKNLGLIADTNYDLTFKLKTNNTAHPFSVNIQKGVAPWTSYGLYHWFAATDQWQSFSVTFTATATATDARLSFNLGKKTGSVWIDDVKMVRHPPDVFRRDFDNGTVILNATNDRLSIPVVGLYRRFTGTQAPHYQYIVDDADASFTAGNWTATTCDSGQWVALGPWYHQWGESCHQSSSTTDTAMWNLGIRADDIYTLDAWWPAAPDAVNWSSAVRYEVIVNGSVIASATLDQTRNGDQWNRIASVALTKAASAQVRITNLQPKPAIADAILVQSTARYNDGSDAPSVELDAKDAIILLKK
ncbi:MAG: carbohydrate binding domain-containing protein [Verrucomicrobia bacterium]|nr:carbohydrate binding domain-containing protein [Verrucomicrobiota bacterium]